MEFEDNLEVNYFSKLQGLFDSNDSFAGFLVQFYGCSNLKNLMGHEQLYKEVFSVFEPSGVDEDVYISIPSENSYTGENERLMVGVVGVVPDDRLMQKVIIR